MTSSDDSLSRRAAFVALAPLLLLQGRYVRRVTTRLPEPTGDRTGTAGAGPELGLLILGDSAAVGVGVETQCEALSGRLVAELSRTSRVSWTLVAKSGATASGTTRHLTRCCSLGRVDVAVVSIGGNDVVSHRSLADWLEDIEALVGLLRTRFAVRHILLSGLPPMHAFPAFPQPLRWYLGAKARKYDVALTRWASRQADCEHVSLVLPNLRELFAADGMHPGESAYRLWAIELAKRIRARWVATQCRPERRRGD